MKAYIYRKYIEKTGKYYVGKHNGNNKYYKGSGTDWIKAIKIYKNIKEEILEYVEDISKLNEREKYWLEYFNAADNPLYYNLTNKSCGCSTEISRKKLSQKMTNHPSLIHNKDRSQKISNSLKNNKERSQKISNSLKNKPKSDLHKKHMKKPKPDGFNDKLKKPIKQINPDGELINIFPSITEAHKMTGFNLQAISNCALGKSKSSFGYFWEFIDK
jgi:hypothetical protein